MRVIEQRPPFCYLPVLSEAEGLPTAYFLFSRLCQFGRFSMSQIRNPESEIAVSPSRPTSASSCGV